MLIWDYCRVELVTRRPTWKELKQFPKKTLAELSGSNCTLWFSTLSHGTQILAVADTTTLLDTLAAGGWECVAAHVCAMGGATNCARYLFKRPRQPVNAHGAGAPDTTTPRHFQPAPVPR